MVNRQGTETQVVRISKHVAVGPGQSLLLIAGPCQIESREHALAMAAALAEATQGLAVQVVYKSSYDKANRTSLSTQRGLGMSEGLAILADVREKFRFPVISDVHDASQVAAAAEVLDILQIPAFLCRQTDLLLAAGHSGRAVHVKKGQFLHPSDMTHVVSKIRSTGNTRILVCERGACFGYRDVLVDMRSLVLMRETACPVIFDATHSVQSMGGAGGSSGGSREYIAPLSRAALAVGVDGLFLECHEQPDRAPSDGPSMLPVQHLRPLLEELLAIRAASPSWHST